ncbi:MAG: 16S rRNA (cytidine(1402)-2'-O)-methyltransferase [Rhodobacteraceae bacterium]|nr:16S rRNA (cytidine(1402)-2'-O)-methyltransferase [Paracoccaceae bacterium]
MKPEINPLEAGLYLVATPIGNARDITLRALDILGQADVIAAEDTRTARKLMSLHGVALGKRPLITYHDHSGPAGRGGILKLIGGGRSVAYVSEAGTPLVADPGFALARDAAGAGYTVTTAPGASAALAALSLSGLPSDRFLFAGFAPTAKGARRRWLEEVTNIPATQIIFESPKRIGKLLTDLCEIAGAERNAAVCRELTKKFEEVLRGTLGELRDQVAARNLKGEIVLVLEHVQQETSVETMQAALGEAMATMSLKDAVADVAKTCNLPRRKVYQAALQIENEK